MHWVGWEKLVSPKAEGGLGFRDLHSLNMAMLAKQTWRLLQNPTSLCARLLKGTECRGKAGVLLHGEEYMFGNSNSEEGNHMACREQAKYQHLGGSLDAEGHYQKAYYTEGQEHVDHRG